MLKKVGNALFVLLFIQRTHVHMQPHAGASLRLRRGADDVFHTIGQFALYNLWVNLQLCRVFVCLLLHFCLGCFLGAQYGAAHGQSHEWKQITVFHIKKMAFVLGCRFNGLC